MTDSDSQPTPSEPTSSEPPASNSSTRTIIIVVLVIVVLAGGGLVAYKLTNKKDAGQPAGQVARQAEAAVVKGDTATIVKLSTAQGKAQLTKLKGSELGGLKFGGCGPLPGATTPTRLCVFSRPGGVLNLNVTAPDGKWLVNEASLGPAGLPPTTTTTT